MTYELMQAGHIQGTITTLVMLEDQGAMMGIPNREWRVINLEFCV